MTDDRLFFDLQLFAEEKTEPATPRRRSEARRKGQAARSADLNAAVGLAAVVLLIFALQEPFRRQLDGLLVWALGEAGRITLSPGNLGALSREMTARLLLLLAPVFALALAAGLLVNFLQVGFIFSAEPLQPRLDNLNPVRGLNRLFSRRALVELLKSVLKVALVGVVAFQLVRGRVTDLLFVAQMGLPAGVAVVTDLVFRVAISVVLVFLPIAVADYVFQRRDFERQMRMSKQEVKEELKQTEGDPQVRSRLRQKQRQLAMHRMMQSVPEATVVITNPTHLAVALQYREGRQDAPRVVAKGAGDIARRIVSVARENGVPVVENRPVAQFLFHHTEIGDFIPAELYQAVAEILALLYRQGRLKLVSGMW